MLSLREFQSALRHAVVCGDAAGMRSLVREQGIPAEHGVQIYRNTDRRNALIAPAARRARWPPGRSPMRSCD